MIEYDVHIDLGDELALGIDLGEELAVDINFEGDVTLISGDCPVITNIFGGYADSDNPGSIDPFAPINGIIEGCT